MADRHFSFTARQVRSGHIRIDGGVKTPNNERFGHQRIAEVDGDRCYLYLRGTPNITGEQLTEAAQRIDDEWLRRLINE